MSNYPPEDHQDPRPEPQPEPPRPVPESNPYFAQGPAAPAPDLDAAAPTLTVNEVRQLNRKAMLFLGGIVALLLAMAFWFMHSLSNRDRDTRKPAPGEVVTTPDLPPAPVVSAPADAQPAQPINVVENAPPLPPEPVAATRVDTTKPVDMGEVSGPAQPQETAGPPTPSLLDRRMADSQNGTAAQMGMPGGPGMPGVAGLPGAAGTGAPVSVETSKPRTSARLLSNPDTLLVRGTYIRCVLETRIITDIPGFASCLVAEPIYSVNGRSLLLPRGTKLLGSYANEQIARGRVGVIWDRAITPNGLDVNMSSPGADGLGGAGHPGHYSSHWGSRITSALLISLVSDLFKYAGEKYGPETGVVYPQSGAVVMQPFQSNTAQTVQQLAQQALQESANRKPTVTINQGSMVSVYVSQDVDFSAVLRNR